MPKNNLNHQVAVLSLPLSGSDGVVQLMPAGTFDAPRGALQGTGPWTLTKELAAKVIDKVARRINDIAIDYEHQTLAADKNGKPAPAAGWISPQSLHFIEGKGLLATAVKWTGAARAHIDADEYRYISPVFSYNAKTGEVLDILHVALTNNPALDGMDPVTLAAATQAFLYSQPDEELPVALATIKKILGLADTATDDELNQAVAALKAKADSAETKDTEIAALKSAALDPAQFVPVAIVTELQTQLAALSAKQETNEIEQLIEKNIAKLPTPGLREWAEKQSVAALTAYLATAPEIAALTRMQTDGKDMDNAAQTGDALVAACKAQWESTASIRSEFVTLEDYTAFKKAEADGRFKKGGN